MRKLLSLALVTFLTLMTTQAAASGQTPTGAAPSLAEKARTKVTRLGTGKQARVEVRLLDNTKLKGYIGEIGEERFTLIDPKHGTVTPVQYTQVQKIKSINHRVVYGIVTAAAAFGFIIVLAALAAGS